MSSEQIDLFSVFNIVIEEPVKEEVKNTKTKSSKEKITKESKVDLISLPKTLFTGTFEPMVLTKELLGSEKVSNKQIKEYLQKQHCQYDPSFTSIDIKKDIYCGFNKSNVICKGQIQLTTASKAYVGADEFDLSSIMTDENCEVDIESICQLVHATYPMITSIGILRNKELLVIVPMNEGKPTSNFPLHISILGRENFDISQDEYIAFLEEEGNKLEDDEELTIDENMIKLMISKRYLDFSEHIDLQFAEGDFVTVSLQVVEKAAKGVTTVSKKYPTTDVVLSLIWTRINITPDDFGGKEEVEESELLAFLNSRYPEYTKERTFFEYNKEDKIIIPILKGSTKGAVVTVTSKSEYEKRIQSGEYELFDYKQDEVTYRVESTPVSLTVASYEQGPETKFELRIPKIPGKLRNCIDALFAEVARTRQTELLVLLYFDIEKQRYSVTVPKQINTGSSVRASYDVDLMREAYPVADIHSHCFHPPFFSGVDNKDELGNRIYGVFGSYATQSSDIYRAGTGGRFVDIQAHDIFTDDIASEQEKQAFIDTIIKYL